MSLSLDPGRHDLFCLAPPRLSPDYGTVPAGLAGPSECEAVRVLYREVRHVFDG